MIPLSVLFENLAKISAGDIAVFQKVTNDFARAIIKINQLPS